MKRLAALAITTALALGGVAGTASAASADTSVTVKGHVLSPTGKAVGRVRVSLRAKPRLSAHVVSRVVRTSATGRYEVHVPRGEYYDLRVSDPGDADDDPADGTWAPTYKRITSTATSIVANQVVHHGAQVSGHVFDSAGEPVQPGLGVTAFTRTPNDDGRSPLNAIVSTRTVRGGAYHFRNLPAATVILSFESPDGNGERWRTEQPGGSLDYRDARAARLVFGVKYTGLSIVFPVVARLSGSLTVDGKAVPADSAASVDLRLLDAEGKEITSESPRSVFTFTDLEAGTYYLRFQVTDSDGVAHAPVYYGGSSTLAGAKAIVVPKGRSVSGLKVALTTR